MTGDASENGAPRRVERAVTVETTNGLHARTASAVCETVAGLEADVTLVADAEPAAATDPLELLALDVPRGNVVAVRATGPQAERAVNAVEAVLTEGPGDG